MASVFARGFNGQLFPAAHVVVRYRSKINIKKPRRPHYERALVLHVTKPYFEKKSDLPVQELCLKPVKKDKDVDPYKNVQAKMFLNWFNNSSTALFFHTNPIKADDLFKARVQFKKINMVLYRCEASIAHLALKGTQYESVLSLYGEPSTPVAVLFGTEGNIAAILKISKKIPQIILLGGIVENQLLSHAELMEYSALGNLQCVQAQFVGVLDSFGSQLIQNLTHGPSTLVGQLERFVELQKEEKV